MTLAELARRVWGVDEPGPLVDDAQGWREPSMWGPIQALEPLGRARRCVGPDGLRFGELFVPVGDVRTVSTERADTVQVATAWEMYPFKPDRTRPLGSSGRFLLGQTGLPTSPGRCAPRGHGRRSPTRVGDCPPSVPRWGPVCW